MADEYADAHRPIKPCYYAIGCYRYPARHATSLIALLPFDSTHVWIERQTVQQLQTWAAVPELTFTLTHPYGRTFNVMFRQPFIDNINEIKPVRPEDEQPTDKMKANIHFRTV